MVQPLLSICVPSRNRQIYFQETINSLLKNRTDYVEFVFSDNSDDGSIMSYYMAAHAQDPLIRFLPATGATLSMQENWERTIRASTGQWVSFIGDDDYIDPDLAGFIQRLQFLRPDIEALDWENLIYHWPGVEQLQGNNFVPLENSCFDVPHEILMRRAFQWEASVVMPISGFSIYHGAVKRELADRIAQTFGGLYFEHPTPDIDFSFKSVLLGRGFAWSQRPFSVTGCCPLSNTAGMYNFEKLKEVYDGFARDLGRDLNDDSYLDDFPFNSILGVPAAALQVQHWLKKIHKLSWTGWEANFVRCCQRFTELYQERNSFDQISALYRRALGEWHEGKFLQLYDPVFRPKERYLPLYGVNLKSKWLYFDAAEYHEPTAYEHYQFASSVMQPLEDLDSGLVDFMDFVRIQRNLAGLPR